MAEGVSKEVRIQAASEALTSQLLNLSGVIDPLKMALQLISKKIIDQSFLEKVRLSNSTNTEKACDILIAVSKKLKNDPDSFITFCDILSKEPVTEDVAKTLKGNVIDASLILMLFCVLFQITMKNYSSVKARSKHFVQVKL